MAAKKKGFNTYKIIGDKTIIYIQNENGERHKTTIDTKNLPKLLDADYCWHLIWEKNIQSYYVKTHVYENKKGKSIYLAKFLMDCPDNMKVDHINHNTLLNTEENLRIVTFSENSKNRKSANKNNKSGYRNVCFMDGYYRVQLQIDKKNRLFKEKFEEPEKANEFAEKMRNKYY